MPEETDRFPWSLELSFVNLSWLIFTCSDHGQSKHHVGPQSPGNAFRDAVEKSSISPHTGNVRFPPPPPGKGK